MYNSFQTKRLLYFIAILLCVSACSPEVGTKKWCEKLDKTPKGDWTANMAADYAKYCLLKQYKDKEP